MGDGYLVLNARNYCDFIGLLYVVLGELFHWARIYWTFFFVYF